MPKPGPSEYFHKDGTLYGRGEKTGETMTGYWEWFRKTGVRMRSGWFDANGAQIGEWTTYDETGAVKKVTTIKPKKA
jgi:hypothetical protein